MYYVVEAVGNAEGKVVATFATRDDGLDALLKIMDDEPERNVWLTHD